MTLRSSLYALLAPAAVVASLSAACGSSGDPSSPDPVADAAAPVPARDAAGGGERDASAQEADASADGAAPDGALAYCRRIFGWKALLIDKCCTAPADRALEASHVKSTETGVEECTALLTGAVKRGRMVHDAKAETTCLAAVDPASVSCSERRKATVGVRPFDPPAACRSVYVGTMAAGEPCRWTDECDAGLVCGGGDLDKAIDGTCHAPAQLGAACEGDFDDTGRGNSLRNEVAQCATGLRCVTAGGALLGECQAATTPAGNTCATSASCVAGTFCQSGVCVPPRSLGAGSTCGALPACQDGLYCPLPSPPPADSPTTCSPLGATGAACFLDDECLGRCDSATKKCVAHCGS